MSLRTCFVCNHGTYLFDWATGEFKQGGGVVGGKVTASGHQRDHLRSAFDSAADWLWTLKEFLETSLLIG